MRSQIRFELQQASTRFSWAVLAVLIIHGAVLGQDNVRGSKEPIVSSIDPSRLTYDILVDGTLEQDDPVKLHFKTLQAAYAAAQPGTEDRRTVIGIKPNVYALHSIPMRRERRASESARTTLHFWV